MSKYFNYFPLVEYSLEDKITNLNLVTNIIFRFIFNDKFKSDTSVFYYYSVKDGDKPEDIAYKVYGSPERHWIILGLNDIVDPLNDWPMDQRTFKAYLDDKYGAEGANNNPVIDGFDWSKANVKNYVIIDTVKDLQTDKLTVEEYNVDANTYANTTVSTTTKTLVDGDQIEIVRTKRQDSYFDYENNINENKRFIKILKPEGIKAVESEFRRLAESS
jgi:hypothetical protein